MKKNVRITVNCFSVVIMLLGICAHSPLFAREEFEKPPTLKASEILAPQLLRGEHHAVEEAVENDGYLNFYRISSDFGDFEAQGTMMLRIRVKEIQALAQLDRLSNTEVFLDAAKDAGIGKAESVADLAEKSVEIGKKSVDGAKNLTLDSVKSGAGRLFKRTKAEAEEKIDESIESAQKTIGDAKKWLSKKKSKKDEPKKQEEQSGAEKETTEEDWKEELGDFVRKVGDRYLGVSKAERQWAEKLGTDPYSSNDILAEAIRQTARIDRLGNLSASVVPVPEVPGTKEIVRFGELLWGKDVEELGKFNQQQLVKLGVDDEVVMAFFQHPHYQSPSLQTVFVTALSQLEDVEKHAVLVEHALAVDSEVEARFFVESVTLLAWYHRNQSPLGIVLEETRFPFAITQNKRLISLLPVDYLFWTGGIANATRGFAASLEALPVKNREFWASGKVSERCQNELAALGWTVRDNVAKLVQGP